MPACACFAQKGVAVFSPDLRLYAGGLLIVCCVILGFYLFG